MVIMYRPTLSGPSFFWEGLLSRVGRSDSNPCSSTALTEAGSDAAQGCRAGKPQRKGTGCTGRAIWSLEQCLNSPVLNTGSNSSTGETQLLERRNKGLCAALGCPDDSDKPGCASSSALHHLHIHCQGTEDTFFSLLGSLTCKEPRAGFPKHCVTSSSRLQAQQPPAVSQQGHRRSCALALPLPLLWPRRGKDRACGSVQK